MHKVDLKGLILKPNMILAGSNCKEKISNEEVAKLTLKCLKESVPSEVPGIAFLSGGQSEIEATENLNLISKYNDTKFIMSYSFGRALTTKRFKILVPGYSKNIEGTQKIFNQRAKMNSLAAQGKWSKNLKVNKKNLFILFLQIKLISRSTKICLKFLNKEKLVFFSIKA